MKQDVSQIRRTLARRKAEKLKNIQGRSKIKTKHENPNIHQKKNKTEKETPIFLKQTMASGMIFLIVLFIFQMTSTTNPTRQWLNKQLKEDFPFAAVNVWYQEQFGMPLGFFVEDTPIPVSNQLSLPVNGVVNQAYDLKGQGIMIEAADQPEVFAIDQGTVLFAGNDRHTNKTVVIQHPDRTKSTYGFLAEINVRPYQFVQASQQIGSTSIDSEKDTNLYFSLQKGNEYLDPIEVISIDDFE